MMSTMGPTQTTSQTLAKSVLSGAPTVVALSAPKQPLSRAAAADRTSRAQRHGASAPSGAPSCTSRHCACDTLCRHRAARWPVATFGWCPAPRVVGLQEAMSDDIYDAFEQRLGLLYGISRLDLTHESVTASRGAKATGGRESLGTSRESRNSRGSDGPTIVWTESEKGKSGDNAAQQRQQHQQQHSHRRQDYIYGRGDGSILSSKFTGIAVYARDSMVQAGRIRVMRVASQSTARLTSKGGAAAVL